MRLFAPFGNAYDFDALAGLLAPAPFDFPPPAVNTTPVITPAAKNPKNIIPEGCVTRTDTGGNENETFSRL